MPTPEQIARAGKSPEEQIEALLAPTALDKGIGRMFPKWGARRIRARREYAYEAARSTRLRTSATRLQGPEDYTAFPERLQLIRQVRDLEQNFGLYQSIIDRLALYAFGRLRYQAHTSDKAVNDTYEDFLNAKFSGIDLSGRHNLRSFVCIAFKSQLRDGDFLFKWQRAADQLKLTGIEGDRLGGLFMQSAAEDYFQGITVNLDTGEPLTYKVYWRSKANTYINPQDFPAQDVIHLYDPRRYNQYRGISPFAPVINDAIDLKEILEDCKIGVKFENRHAAIGYTESGLPINDPASFISGTETNSTGTPLTEQEIKPGLIQWAPSTARYEMIKSDRPSGNFQTYLESLIRLIGHALGLPYGFAYNLSGLSGPAARMDSQQAMRVIQWHQQNMIDRVLERVKNTLLLDGFASGEIKYAPDWTQGEWQFPPWPTIDVGREAAADLNDWKAGLLSKATIFAENGQDAEEQEAVIVAEADRTIKQAQELATANKIPFETALNILSLRTPNGLMPPPAPGAKPEPGNAG